MRNRSDETGGGNIKRRCLMAACAVVATLVLIICGAVPDGRAAARPTPATWPCDQVYIPEITLAALWQGPSIADRLDSWWDDSRVLKAMESLENPLLNEDEVRSHIRRFAGKLAADEKEGLLLSLFAGLYQHYATKYEGYLESILRFAERQERVTRRISEKSSALREMRKEGTPIHDPAYKRLEGQLEWNARVFDERNRLTPYICEEPLFLRQQLGFRARAIVDSLR